LNEFSGWKTMHLTGLTGLPLINLARAMSQSSEGIEGCRRVGAVPILGG
jgi:hypothetical protein